MLHIVFNKIALFWSAIKSIARVMDAGYTYLLMSPERPPRDPNTCVSASTEPLPGIDLLSVAFEKTPTLHRLLFYLLDRRNEELSEYRIAVEALGRRLSFESQFDSAVRVHISRLRVRLKNFYETEGSHLSTRVVIPLGTHKVQFIEVKLQDQREEYPPQPHPGRRSRWRYGVLCLVFILCYGGSMLWMRQHTRQEDEARNQQIPLPAFWQNVLGNGKRSLVIFPNPVFFLWPHHLVARDWRINTLSKVSSSTNLAPLEKSYGTPLIAQYYANSVDISASWRLARFLDPMGKQIEIKGTEEFSASSLDWDNNLIAIGDPNSLSAPFQSFLNRLSFQLDVHNSDLHQWVVEDRRPAPGAPAKFASVQKSATVRLIPSIVALLPGGARGAHILLGVTDFTPALVTYLISESGLQELEKARASHGHCQYFEAVVLTETDGDTELGSKLAEFKPYNEKP